MTNEHETDPLARLRAMVEATPARPWTVTGDLAGYEVIRDRDGRSVPPSRETSGAVTALRNVAPELLAVVEAARPWTAIQRCSQGCACAPCRLGDALDGLRAKLAEALR